MNYKAFYAEIVDWINQANQMAVKHGIISEDFWDWVVASTTKIGETYNNNPLVIKQLLMLINWLEDIYDAEVSQQ